MRHHPTREINLQLLLIKLLLLDMLRCGYSKSGVGPFLPRLSSRELFIRGLGNLILLKKSREFSTTF